MKVGLRLLVVSDRESFRMSMQGLEFGYGNRMALCVGIRSPAQIPAGAFSYTGMKCYSSRLRIVCAVQSREDNVRSTLKALKSQNHRPKKWLGQVSMLLVFFFELHWQFPSVT